MRTYLKAVIDNLTALNCCVKTAINKLHVVPTPIHDAIPSHAPVVQGCSRDVIVPPTVSAFSFLKSIFYGYRVNGVCNSIFTTSSEDLHSMLLDHGLQTHPDLSVRDNRYKLLQHLIHGDCYLFAHRTAADCSSHRDRHACFSVAQGTANSAEISSMIDTLVTNSTSVNINTGDLISLVESTGVQGPFHNPRNLRNKLLSSFHRYSQQILGTTELQKLLPRHFDPLNDLFHGFQDMPRGALMAVIERHGIELPSKKGQRQISCKELRNCIVQHVTDGSCLRGRNREACDDIAESVLFDAECLDSDHPLAQTIALFRSLKKSLPRVSLQRMLKLHNIEHDGDGDLASLRVSLQDHIRKLTLSLKDDIMCSAKKHLEDQRHEAVSNWPQTPSDSFKNKIVKLFHEQTSSATLKREVCASCSEYAFASDCTHCRINDIDFSLLRASETLAGQ